MTPAEFKKKWSKFAGKESSGYQSHFDDLCRLLKVPTPSEADPDAEFFCFQKRVVKDAELFAVAESGEEAGPDERGFADVWKRGCFAWEYKGKRKNLDEAYKQLLRYREALENPPLLVVCDFDRYVVKTNFNGTVQEVFEFTNDTLDSPENLRVLRALFGDPDSLKPQRTTAQVTETLAGTIAEVAKVIALAFADDFHFGVLQSRVHEIWTEATQGLHGGERPTYNPTACFETFAFPHPAQEQETAIAAAAKTLNELRENWLNPPEWTETRMLEFPGSVSGPWARYVDPATVNAKTGVGTVRYPRLEPKDAEHAAKLKKRTLTNLYNERPAWLANAHKTLDAAVAAAYGWPADLTDEQILERLLALNLERAAEEAKSAQTTKPAKKPQRAKGEGGIHLSRSTLSQAHS